MGIIFIFTEDFTEDYKKVNKESYGGQSSDRHI